MKRKEDDPVMIWDAALVKTAGKCTKTLMCLKHIKMKAVAKDWRRPVLSGSFQVQHRCVKPVSALKKKPALRKLERRISLTPDLFHKNCCHPDRYLELSMGILFLLLILLIENTKCMCTAAHSLPCPQALPI